MSLLKIITNLDCNVYVDTELKGEALSGAIYKIEMRKGRYILDFISRDSGYDKIQMDYYMEDSDMEDLIRIDLLSMQQARIEEEKKKKDLFAERIKKYFRYPSLIGCEQGKDYSFSEGLAVVCLPYVITGNCSRELEGSIVPGKYGYINEMGEEVISCQYEYAEKFSEGMAAVRAENYLWGYIDKTGSLIIPYMYVEVGSFSNGLAWFNDGEVIDYIHPVTSYNGYINREGDIVVPAIYDVVNDFKDYRAIVGRCIGGILSYGLIDTNGKEIVPLEYDYITNFSDGLALVGKKGKYGYVNIHGEVIIPLIYDSASDFSEGLAAVKDSSGYWGYIDTLGEIQIPCKYTNAYAFGEGLDSVRNRGYVKVNAKGIPIIPYQQGWLYDSSFSGCAIVSDGSQKFKIDKEGNVLEVI